MVSTLRVYTVSCLTMIVWSLRHWTRRANPVEWVLHRCALRPRPELTCASFEKQKDIEQWTEYSDKDVGGAHARVCSILRTASLGKTKSRLLFDPAGRAIFEGHLNIEIPKGARLVRSGYAAVMSPVRSPSPSQLAICTGADRAL